MYALLQKTGNTSTQQLVGVLVHSNICNLHGTSQSLTSWYRSMTAGMMLNCCNFFVLASSNKSTRLRSSVDSLSDLGKFAVLVWSCTINLCAWVSNLWVLYAWVDVWFPSCHAVAVLMPFSTMNSVLSFCWVFSWVDPRTGCMSLLMR